MPENREIRVAFFVNPIDTFVDRELRKQAEEYMRLLNDRTLETTKFKVQIFDTQQAAEKYVSTGEARLVFWSSTYRAKANAYAVQHPEVPTVVVTSAALQEDEGQRFPRSRADWPQDRALALYKGMLDSPRLRQLLS